MPTARCGKDLWVPRGMSRPGSRNSGLKSTSQPPAKIRGDVESFRCEAASKTRDARRQSRERIPADCEH